MKKDDDDQRVGKLIGEIVKLLPERSKIKTDLLYFKYAPILIMLTRWYVVSQFYYNPQNEMFNNRKTKRYIFKTKRIFFVSPSIMQIM